MNQKCVSRIILKVFLLNMVVCVQGLGAQFIVGTYDARSTFDDPTPQRVLFDQRMDAVPLVFALTSDDGGQPALIRVFNADRDGFSSLIVETPGRDGLHLAMPSITYIAIVPGTVNIAGGPTIHAGSITTNAARGHTPTFTNNSPWQPVTFGTTIGTTTNPPAVLTGIQTNANNPSFNASNPADPFLSVAHNQVNNLGLEVNLERLETGSGNVNEFNGLPLQDETIGWLAVEQGIGSFEVDGETIFYDFDVSGGITGWDNGGGTANFTQTFDNAPLVAAQMNSRNGNNGGFLRRGAITTSGIDLIIDEDDFNDDERGHIAENVGFLAFSNGFVYIPEPSTMLLLALGCGITLLRRQRSS